MIQCTGWLVLGEEARALEAALERGAHQATRLVLNLAGLERMDSIGLGLLVRFCTLLGRRGGDLRLASPSPFVVSLLKLTTLTKVFKLFRSEEEAIASFRKLGSLPKLPVGHGRRVLFFDPSADLCVFVQSVLACHGFEVRVATNMVEAKYQLSEEPVDVLLIGPCIAQLTPERATLELAEAAPEADTLHLPLNIKSLDAERAAEALLTLFPSGTSATLRASGAREIV